MHARIAALVSALGLQLGCVSTGSSEGSSNADDRPAGTTARSPNRSCRAPDVFETQYSNGKVLLRAEKVDGVSSWTYYSESGLLLLTEKRSDGHPTFISTYHPNGHIHLEGRIALDPETSALRADGIWELRDEEEVLHARALLTEGELELASAQSFDTHGRESELSFPTNLFSFEEAASLVPIKAPFPANAVGEDAQKETCTLVCLDEAGKQLGIFRLSQVGSAFDEASEVTIRDAKFRPRTIGGNGYPSCLAVSVSYEVLWATKVLRNLQPMQRMPRGRRR